MGSKILALEIALYGKMVTITISKEQQQKINKTSRTLYVKKATGNRYKKEQHKKNVCKE